MAVEVVLPRVDMDMTIGKFTQWFVAEGAGVEKGQPLFEIETDKAAMEIEAPASGVLREATAAPGDELPVGSVIGRIFAPGEAYEAYPAAGVSAVAEVPPAAEAAARPQAEAARDLARASRATPKARRIARDNGVDLASVAGSGPQGRIQARDVSAAAARGALRGSRPDAGVAEAAGEAAAIAAEPASGLAAGETNVEIPHSNMRKAIARRLLESKTTIPHFYLAIECRVDRLLALRNEINASAARKISVNDFVVRAAALALKIAPDVNVAWTETALIRLPHADIAVAVSTDTGLFTPIVRAAETKAVSVISAEIAELAQRARAGKLKPEEYQGGSFSVSNLGMLGVDSFTAIINPPQAAILAVGAARQAAVVVDGAVEVASVMACSLSVDHRAIDGARGAQWLAAFKGLIESPLSLLA